MKSLSLLLPLAVTLWITSSPYAQVDPGVMPVFLVTTLDGERIAEVTVTETGPGATREYAFVGEEAWHWLGEPWPDDVLVLSPGAGSRAEPDAIYHQAVFPERAVSATVPDGDLTYAIQSAASGELLGWLVVADAADPGSALTWAILENAPVGDLLDLGRGAVRLEPASPPSGALWLRVIAQSAL